jgi:protein TonB
LESESKPPAERDSLADPRASSPPPRDSDPGKAIAVGAADGGPVPGQAGTPGDSRFRRGEKGSVRQEYIARILRKLQAEKRYPPDARQKGWEGDAEVTVTIAANGSLLAVDLRKATAFRLLDEEAADMVRRAAPFDPIPREVGLEKWKLIVPIRFRIHERM